MKHAKAVAMSSVLVWLAGCASAPKVVIQEPVGPCHRVPSEALKDGTLQVYTARAKADVDPNMEEWLWNNDFGKNEFLYARAHSGYTISFGDGKALQQVTNARGINDEKPTLVRLAPGLYTVEAEAEESGTATITVVIPVVVEAGQITAVHLEPNRKLPNEAQDPSRVVRLSDGRIISCRAERLFGQYIPTAAPAALGEALPAEP